MQKEHPNSHHQNLADEIARFRYGLIAPVLHEMVSKQKAWFRQISNQQFVVPGSKKPRQFSQSTLKTWLSSYRTGGYPALYLKKRSDKGQARVIGADIPKKITAILEDFPGLSAAGVFRKLMKEGIIKPGEMSESTLRRFMRQENMRKPVSEVKARKKFETAAVNQLWVTDFMHGPEIPDPAAHNRKKKVYLCAILDDHSRLIVAARFYYQEDSISLMHTFKKAVNRYGIPQRFYCDNGAAFSTSYLTTVCARLQITLVHSKPYDSPSRGKIERFFGTVRRSFLASIMINEFKSLESFNQAFEKWLDADYLSKEHSATHQNPKDRYFSSLNTTLIQRQAPEAVEDAFLVSHIRKVHKDATLRLHAKIFEVDPKYIGLKVELKHPVDDPNNIHITDSNGQKMAVKPVDKIGNSETPALSIRFQSLMKSSGEVRL